MRSRLRPVVAALAALTLAGCGAGAGASAPTWVPKPSFQGEGGPGGSAAAQGPIQSNAPSAPSSPQPSGSNSPAQDPAVVATNLTSPRAIAVLPDNTALVGERTTGRIVRVQPQPGKPVTTVRTLSGLSGAGGGGLLDLALSPNYAQDSLIFAYVSTAADNRVVAFTLTGPVTAVLTGLPRGRSDNTGRIAFGDDGKLYIGTSDAGKPVDAPQLTSLAGKVLRVTDVGQPVRDNPDPASAVFTRGHRLVDGLCLIPGFNLVLEVESKGADGLDEVNLLQPGADYGWPQPGTSSEGPIATLPAAHGNPGGCAILDNVLYVTSLDGQSLLSSPLTEKGGAVSAGRFTPTLTHQYGRLLTVVAAADGALWLTTSNRDGSGRPVATDDRVLRIRPSGSESNFPG